MAQAAPELHNMYEAYRRMYMALGVRDIDVILPQPPKPQPLDPARENANALAGQKLEAFPQQDHEAHMDAHRAFMSSVLVRQNPQVMSILQAHISEHISLLATEQVQEKMKEQIAAQQQMMMQAQQNPQMQQQAQQAQQILDIELSKMVAIMVGEITSKMLAEEEEMLESQSQDPLVDLKQQEIDIKKSEAELKAQQMGEKQALEEKKRLKEEAKMTKEFEKIELDTTFDKKVEEKLKKKVEWEPPK